MIIDFHTHIFPPEIKNHRDARFSSEPDFKLLYGFPKAKIATTEDLITAMDENGVHQSVVFGFPWKNSETVKAHNDYILGAVAEYPERLKGFCCVDPMNDRSAAEVIRCLNAGLSGVGEIAYYGNGFDQSAQDQLAPIMDICRERNLPILIHTNEPIGHDYHGKSPMTLAQILSVVKRYRSNTLVLAHWGGGIFFFNLLKKQVKETLTNVFVDTAASPFLYDPLIYQIALQIIGADKILFGSDYPLIKPERYFKEMKACGISRDDQEKICGRNAVKILNG
ncbi:MAG TPA: amidohydrolase [Deltaproteobacteria bacterium]|nr:amidohydrolase [Deltaproteobacteria bacterium]